MIRILLFFVFLSFEFFSVAQCDSLKLSRFSVDAFSDTAMGFNVDYTGAYQYNYPSYKAVDNFGDTIALSDVNTFIISSGIREKLDFKVGVQNPINFDGKILVYSDFEDSLQCIIPINENLCVYSDSCNKVAISMGNYGGAMVIGEFDFKVVDAQNNNYHSGSFVLSNTSQESTDIVCLPAGKYFIEIDSSAYLGGQVFINSKTIPDDFYNSAYQYLYQKTSIKLDVFPLCQTNTNSILEKQQIPNNLYVYNNSVYQKGSEIIDFIAVYSITGKRLMQINKPNLPLTFNKLSSGIYLLQSSSNNKLKNQKIVIE